MRLRCCLPPSGTVACGSLSPGSLALPLGRDRSVTWGYSYRSPPGTSLDSESAGSGVLNLQTGERSKGPPAAGSGGASARSPGRSERSPGDWSAAPGCDESIPRSSGALAPWACAKAFGSSETSGPNVSRKRERDGASGPCKHSSGVRSRGARNPGRRGFRPYGAGSEAASPRATCNGSSGAKSRQPLVSRHPVLTE